jgi:ABC-type dipeptide/oligopeptide/nickel transport system permease subunit
MHFSIDRVKLRIWVHRIKGFWQEFRRSRIGLLGAVIIFVFSLVGVIGPLIAPYEPYEPGLAAPLAMPEWLKILPQYSNLASTGINAVNFTVHQTQDNMKVEFETYDPELFNVTGLSTSRVWKLSLEGNSTGLSQIELMWNFTYSYLPPPVIRYAFRWRATNLNHAAYNLELNLVKWGTDINCSLWDSNYIQSSPLVSYKYKTSYLYADWPQLVDLRSDYAATIRRLSPQLGMPEDSTSSDLPANMMPESGEYGLVMHVRLNAKSSNATCEIDMLDPEFSWLGAVHGILGTDQQGADVFSQLLYGVRISLIIGLMVAAVATSVGTLVGVAAGYFGGFVDELSMRTVDLLLCLPILPLLLSLIVMFGRNIYLMMFLLVLFSWMVLARAVRSQVLSLRESAFIESAIVSGGSKTKILRKHIIPNIMPLAFTSMMLAVPGAILTEAVLSFLGFSDPNVVTWGRIINQAMASNALGRMAWWWIFPPGFAIMILCAGFVFISHALDQSLNPRLRRRR